MDWILERLLLLVPLWLSLSVHEWAHAWTANRLGDDTARLLGRMTVDPLAHVDWIGTVLLPFLGVPLGWAKPVPVNPLRFKGVSQAGGLLLAAGAGPLSNVVLALAGALVYRLLAPWPLAAPLQPLLETAVPLNLGLAAFNLLPLPPLDGSRVADALVPYRHRATWARVQQAGPLLLALLLVVPELWGFGLLSGLQGLSGILLGVQP